MGLGGRRVVACLHRSNINHNLDEHSEVSMGTPQIFRRITYTGDHIDCNDSLRLTLELSGSGNE